MQLIIFLVAFVLTIFGAYNAIQNSCGLIAVLSANIFFWVSVWVSKVKDEKIRDKAVWLGLVPAISFILYFYSFSHPKIAHRFEGALLILFGSRHIFTVQIAAMVFTAISFIIIYFWGRIFGKNYQQRSLEKYYIKYPKKILHDKHVKDGLKKNLGFYLGYNLGIKDNSGKYDINALPGPTYLTEGQRLRHTHVLGTTASGKTTGVMFPLIRYDINAGRGLIFIDAKGDIENAKTIYKIAADANREKDFLFFSIAHPELSQTYNPLQYGNPTQLKDKITGAIDWSEPFYQRICENALQTLFMEHNQNGPFDREETPMTLKELYSVLQNPPAKYYEFSKLKEQNQRNIQTLENEIGILINTTFASLLGEPKGKIDLLDAYKNKKIVYFALDTQSYGATATRLGKMITQDINTLSGFIQSEIPQSERSPMGIFIDEYQAFGTKNFINCLARGRASGLMITIAHQSIGDLDAIDKAYTDQINQNTNTKIFLQSNDPQACELFSNMLGTRRTIEETRQEVLAGPAADKQMGTHKVVDEYLLGPQIVRELQQFEAAYKYQTDYGKLVLHPYFVDEKELDRIALPEQRKLQETSATQIGETRPQAGQDEGLKESPKPPKTIF